MEPQEPLKHDATRRVATRVEDLKVDSHDAAENVVKPAAKEHKAQKPFLVEVSVSGDGHTEQLEKPTMHISDEQEKLDQTPTIRVAAIKAHDKNAQRSEEQSSQTVRMVAEPQASVSKKKMERKGMPNSVQMAPDVEDPLADRGSTPQEAAPPTPQDPASRQSDAPPAAEAPTAEAPTAEAPTEEAPTAEAPTAQPEAKPETTRNPWQKQQEEANNQPSAMTIILAVSVILIAVCVVIFVVFGSKAQIVEWGQGTVAQITGRRGEGADRELSEKRHLVAGPQKTMLSAQRSKPNLGDGGHRSGHESFSNASKEYDDDRMKSAGSQSSQDFAPGDRAAGSDAAKPAGRYTRPPRS